MTTKTKRATIYFDPEMHKALRLKSAETETSMSDLVDEAIRLLLIEDADDLAAIAAAQNEPAIAFEDFVRDLQARGKL
jgi:hypothetical protein